MDVAIDTSALSLLADRSLLEKLITAVGQRDHRLVLPYPALLESSMGGPSYVVRGFEVLVQLQERLGPKFVISEDLPAISRRERNPWRPRPRRGSPPRLRRTPELAGVEAERLNMLLREPTEERLRVLQPAIEERQQKAQFLALDRTAEKGLKHLLKQLESADVPKALHGFLKQALSPKWNFVLERNGGREYAHLMRKGPRRYRSLTVYCCLLWLYMLGMMLKGFSGQEHEGLLNGPRNGEWIDARIAGCAAYSRLFLSEDRRLRRKLAWVAKQLGLALECSTLESWLQPA